MKITIKNYLTFVLIEPEDWSFGIGWDINEYVKSIPGRKFDWNTKTWMIPTNQKQINTLNSILPHNPFTEGEEELGNIQFETFMNQFE